LIRGKLELLIQEHLRVAISEPQLGDKRHIEAVRPWVVQKNYHSARPNFRIHGSELLQYRRCLRRQLRDEGSDFAFLETPGHPGIADHSYGDLICECELVTRDRVLQAITEGGAANVDDIRRDTRLGMGPCQGGFCIYRATGILHGLDGMSADDANGALLGFLQERWKGMWPILYGDQLRQARLDDWIFQGILDVEHLPS